MALTLSGTNGIVGAGFTVDNSGVSVTAGVGTFSSVQGSGANLTALPAANLTGSLPAISAANCTNIPAANITGTLPAISGANLTGIAAGITHARSYRITATFATAGDSSADLTANWAYSDLEVGSGWSLPSSGIFTFPTTGMYEVSFQTLMYASNGVNAPYVGFEILKTTNNSSYSTAAVTYQSCSDDLASTRWFGATATALIDCTDTSNVKVKVIYYRHAGYGNVSYYSSNSNDATGLVIKRIGDT